MKQLFYTLFFISLPFYAEFHDPYHAYFWGQYNLCKGNNYYAESLFNQLIEKKYCHLGYEGLINTYFSQRRFHDILRLEHYFQKYLNEDLDAALIFIKTCEFCNHTNKASQLLLHLCKKHIQNPEVAYGAATIHIKQNNLEKALDIITQYLQAQKHEKNTDFIFYFLASKIHVDLGNPLQAQKDIYHALELNPRFKQGWLLSGLVAELTGEINEAIDNYKKFIQLAGNDPHIEQQIVRLMTMKHNHTRKSQSVQGFLEQAILLYEQGKIDKALETINICLQTEPSFKAALLFKLELLQHIGSHEKAFTLLENLLNHYSHDATWYRALFLMYQSGHNKHTILQLLSSLSTKDQTNIHPLLYQADIQIKEKMFTQAGSTLNQALSITSSSHLKEKILYQLLLLYYTTKNYSAIPAIAQQADQLKATYAPLYNLLAYFYAKKSKNINHAKKYIRLALQLEKRNMHYLDTLAVIFIQEQKFNQALNLLRTIDKKLPHDPYVKKHLSQALYVQGKKQDAIYTLQKAVDLCKQEKKRLGLQKLMSTWNTP